MAKVRHGVAGDPVGHSLSPVLTALVHSHLSHVEGVKLPGLKGVVVIPTDGVENALAWGYAGSIPSPPDWELVGSPLGKFRANTLLERAVTASMEHVEADPRLPNAALPEQGFTSLPPGSQEVWLSLTTPLKHQLSAAAVKCIDNSMQIRSVNALRWDGHTWSAASTDGPGMMLVAEAFGHSFGGVLGIVGGGGTARSVAASWCDKGGTVRQLGGNRLLEEDGPWVLCDDDPDFVIDFDNGEGDIIVTYEPMEGDFDNRIEQLASVADGRWLLCAQHLHSWARIWAPNHSHLLPSLSLLMTRLVAVEVHLG